MLPLCLGRAQKNLVVLGPGREDPGLWYHGAGGVCSPASAGTHTPWGDVWPGRSRQHVARMGWNGANRLCRELQVVAAGVLEDGWAAGAVDDGVGDTVGLGTIVSS